MSFIQTALQTGSYATVSATPSPSLLSRKHSEIGHHAFDRNSFTATRIGFTAISEPRGRHQPLSLGTKTIWRTWMTKWPTTLCFRDMGGRQTFPKNMRAKYVSCELILQENIVTAHRMHPVQRSVSSGWFRGIKVCFVCG